MLVVTQGGKCPTQQRGLQGGHAEAHSVDMHVCPARLRCAPGEGTVVRVVVPGSPAHFLGTADAQCGGPLC